MLGVPPSVGGRGDVTEAVLALDLPLVRAREKVVEDFERRYVQRILAQHGGNVTSAAAASGIAGRYFQLSGRGTTSAHRHHRHRRRHRRRGIGASSSVLPPGDRHELGLAVVKRIVDSHRGKLRDHHVQGRDLLPLPWLPLEESPPKRPSGLFRARWLEAVAVLSLASRDQGSRRQDLRRRRTAPPGSSHEVRLDSTIDFFVLGPTRTRVTVGEARHETLLVDIMFAVSRAANRWDRPEAKPGSRGCTRGRALGSTGPR